MEHRRSATDQRKEQTQKELEEVNAPALEPSQEVDDDTGCCGNEQQAYTCTSSQ